MENKIKNSETYLKSVLGKESGFSVPKNYFDSVEENFSITITKESFSKENVFSTPSNYFNALEDKIILRVSSEQKASKVISLKQRILKALPIAAAASVLLFIGLTYFTNTASEVNFENIAQSDIENWILDNSSDIITQDIATFIPIENMDDAEIAFVNINDEEIEDYIIYDDNTSIINEIN